MQVSGNIHTFAIGYNCEIFTPLSIGHRSAHCLGFFYAH
nr:MAG TPA: hypothetical protein [Caudoviricetes sp.]